MLLFSPISAPINTSISIPIGIILELYFEMDEHVRKSLAIWSIFAFLPLSPDRDPQFVFTGNVRQFVFISPDT